MDWPEDDFKFESCNAEFKSVPESISKRMISTLAWQWETDSIAARTLSVLMAPFVTNSELQRLYARITENEYLHAATYSEIVRNSFDDPNEIMGEVLAARDAMERLKMVAEVMEVTAHVGARMGTGDLTITKEAAYEAAMMYVVALFALERIQFMASFAVTFAIGSAGMFIPIASAVQKICQDEYDIHVEVGRYVLKYEMNLPQGQQFMSKNKDVIKNLCDQIVNVELDRVDYLGLDEEPMVGITSKLLKDWVYFCAGDVYRTLGIESDFTIPRKNPAGFMEQWIDISKMQNSLQEQESGQYKINVTRRTLSESPLDVDF
jgi:ribonucleoside-diphosphate reductase beta chain